MQNISKIDSVTTQVFSYLEDPDVVSVASVCLQWAGQYHWWKGFFFSWMRDCGIKTLLPTSKLSFWLGFWSSYLCRCVPAGGQVSVQ